ncbi:hypothetical protein CK203_008236 [Vitis vinifera]|uniref:Uncharacterized protein n=1 Tax=Vitis vinifera TaxID=29760 RepID=A0A438KNI7_VITVI|nr:hypothetical protein CK203_008236 [Vitis vinifera]
MADHSTNVTPLQDSGEIPTSGSGLITGQTTSQMTIIILHYSVNLLRSNSIAITPHLANQMLNVVIASGFDDILDGTRPCPPHFLPDPNSTFATTIQISSCKSRITLGSVKID